MPILTEVPTGGASNDSGVVDDGIFIVYGEYFFGHFRNQRARLIMLR